MTEWAHRVRPQTARPVVAPYRVATFNTRRTTGERLGRRVSTGSRNSPLVLPHSGNGRENGDASEPTPRRYISTTPPEPSSPVNGGPGADSPCQGEMAEGQRG